MTVAEAQRAAKRGGHILQDAGRTPNGLDRVLVCRDCGGTLYARSADDAGGDITVWSCAPGDSVDLERERRRQGHDPWAQQR